MLNNGCFIKSIAAEGFSPLCALSDIQVDGCGHFFLPICSHLTLFVML